VPAGFFSAEETAKLTRNKNCRNRITTEGTELTGCNKNMLCVLCGEEKTVYPQGHKDEFIKIDGQQNTWNKEEKGMSHNYLQCGTIRRTGAVRTLLKNRIPREIKRLFCLPNILRPLQ